MIGVDRVPERLARVKGRGAEVIDLSAVDDVGEEVRSLTQGRGADAVIDAVGMEAHGSPVAEMGQKLFNVMPKRLSRRDHEQGRASTGCRRSTPPSTRSAAAARSR